MQASPTHLLEAAIFLHKVLRLVGGFLVDAGLSHIGENDGTLFADRMVQSMVTSLHLCTCMEAELFVDGRLSSLLQ